jgi:AraC family transcriptional regulator
MLQQQRVWFITGCSTGFGRALTEVMLEQGDRVVATARSPQKLENLVEQYGDRVFTLPLEPANACTSAYWESEHQFMMLAFEPELLTRQLTDTTESNPVELLPIINPSDPLIYHIGLTLIAELKSGSMGGCLYVDAMKIALMAHLLRHYSV